FFFFQAEDGIRDLYVTGVQTCALPIFGPLTNPARPPFQILGASHRSVSETMASALARLGVQKGWVVHGGDGLDEITIADRTFVRSEERRVGKECRCGWSRDH